MIPTTSRSPESVQPGGGTVLALELLWGRCRRAWLRAVAPAYVRAMLARRQGVCPDCPHDIVDPRDLKFTRNVCGYWFHAEDDAFRWRGQVGFARHGLAELLLSTAVFLLLGGALLTAALVVHAAFWVFFALAALVWLEVVYFFRDPRRAIPSEAEVLVSPADGTITHIEEVDEPDFGRALRISIFLSIFNVHVNRMPCSARVSAVRYFPGAFLDARNRDCAARNEQLWVDLVAPDGRPVRVKQISGAIARRIVCWLKPGDELPRGERFGMIKFGSRTDLLVPSGPGLRMAVQVGAAVRGGSTVLLRDGTIFRAPPLAPPTPPPAPGM